MLGQPLRHFLLPLALAAAAGLATAQVAPAVSLAEQMRGMLGKPAATTEGASLGVFNAPIVVNGPVQIRQSAAELAQRFPAPHRAAMTKAYEEAFGFWQKLETQLGLVPNDVAAGVAAFIAGNYTAFMQQPVADEDFKSLVLQMQSLLARNPAFVQSSPAAKRAMFEQLAMVGTFMVVYREHLNRQPSPGEEVNFRNAAKANLEAGLGLAVERLQIGPQGLVVR
ncbi:DUF6683 family protein [Roseateles puraquae]|uniref:DUF2059 domain-containing protein n=1 Tax=Roseateles puraquae TaxID=431059 RepID=A0A254NBA6_9BURK|nr:DUF6683 family protein [Roseateles puraquae]MDG0856484.1 hypothetical protein [Roseateles puraquae]OWR02698.1 hypothetical protein CDO81_17870 [Roseateles puraquae]